MDTEVKKQVIKQDIDQLYCYLKLAVMTSSELNTVDNESLQDLYIEIPTNMSNNVIVQTPYDDYYDIQFFMFDNIQLLELVRNSLFLQPLFDNNLFSINDLVDLFSNVTSEPVLTSIKFLLIMTNFEIIVYDNDKEMYDTSVLSAMINVCKSL